MTLFWARTERKVCPLLTDEDKKIMSTVYKIACMKHINERLFKQGMIPREMYRKMNQRLLADENEVLKQAEILCEKREREAHLAGQENQ